MILPGSYCEPSPRLPIVLNMTIIVTDWVPEIGCSGSRNQPKNGFLGKLKKAFHHFLPTFWHICDDFSKWRMTKARRNFEKSSNLPTHFSTHCRYPKIRFQVPIPSLIVRFRRLKIKLFNCRCQFGPFLLPLGNLSVER